jgi:predicted ATPase
MITRFYADNYMGLVDFDFRPAPTVNLILGKNGSGKSSFFEAIERIRDLIFGANPKQLFLADTFPWNDTTKIQTFELSLIDQSSGDRFAYRVQLRFSDGVGTTIREENLFHNDRCVFKFEHGKLAFGVQAEAEAIRFDGRHSAVSLGIGGNESIEFFAKSVAALSTFKINPYAFQFHNLSESNLLLPDGQNLVGFLLNCLQNRPDVYSDWKLHVAESMPWFNDVQLREASPGKWYLTGLRKINGVERGLDFNKFSEGERCLLALHAIASAQNAGGVICLDEPDNFLAPSEIQPILRRFTIEPDPQNEPQVFVVTHHPEAIDYLASYKSWLFQRDSGGIVKVKEISFNPTGEERPSETILFELSA